MLVVGGRVTKGARKGESWADNNERKVRAVVGCMPAHVNHMASAVPRVVLSFVAGSVNCDVKISTCAVQYRVTNRSSPSQYIISEWSESTSRQW